ncbi:ribonuclease H family protein [Thalassotalea sp. G2M2-11]|uniref:ribonuclease H family protein n=1 Tax=Thalassotalea sp. G2M2-11 TaxID=2787627 RepID=UPI0019D035CC|nr:ribonuclease H family protein [Thalassotalea sp. G2M2-11]
MAKKYYVIWKGAQTGIFDNWPQVQQLTAGRADAQYMGFPSQAEAQAAFTQTYTKALMKRSLTKGNSNTDKKSSVSSQKSRQVSNHADINIYSDGACSPNPGKSGTGIAVYQKEQLSELWYGLYHPNGTNNTAELNGLLEALKLGQLYINQGKQVQVLSDSKYSIDCITKWAAGWQKKGWKKADGQAIKNPELVQACYQLYLALKAKLIITHVKGHADIEGNELADRMAVYARMQQETGFVQYKEKIDIANILAMPSG